MSWEGTEQEDKMAKKEPDAKVSKNGNGDRKWRRIERPRFRFWRADDDSTPITGVLGERIVRDGKFGSRAHYPLRVTEPGEDRKGAYGVGELLAIGESATLKDLVDLVGKEVRISPAGLDGRVKLYDVDVAE